MQNVVDYKIIEDGVRELRCAECGAAPKVVSFGTGTMSLTIECPHDDFLDTLNAKYSELKNNQTKEFVRIV